MFPILRGAETPTFRLVYFGDLGCRVLWDFADENPTNHASSTHHLGISGYWTFSILLSFRGGPWSKKAFPQGRAVEEEDTLQSVGCFPQENSMSLVPRAGVQLRSKERVVWCDMMWCGV